MITFWFFLLCIQHIPTRNIFRNISKGSLYDGRLKTKAFVLKCRIHFNCVHHLLMYSSVHKFWLHFEHTEERFWKLLTYVLNESMLESPTLLRSHQEAMFKVIQSTILDPEHPSPNLPNRSTRSTLCRRSTLARFPRTRRSAPLASTE